MQSTPFAGECAGALSVVTTDSQIDVAILAVLDDRGGHWTKVAWVAVSARDRLGSDFPSGEAGHRLVAKRIAALVAERRLLAKGDITQWRFSEVRRA